MCNSNIATIGCSVVLLGLGFGTEAALPSVRSSLGYHSCVPTQWGMVPLLPTVSLSSLLVVYLALLPDNPSSNAVHFRNRYRLPMQPAPASLPTVLVRTGTKSSAILCSWGQLLLRRSSALLRVSEANLFDGSQSFPFLGRNWCGLLSLSFRFLFPFSSSRLP